MPQSRRAMSEVRQHRDADRRIEAIADHVDRGVAQVQINRDLRIFGEELRQKRRKAQDAKRHRRRQPHQAADRASASSSAASPSERMCAARADGCRPPSVNAIRRDVRLNNHVLSFASTLLTAFETVALESLSSAAAAAKERASATFAKIAKPSRSGNFDMSNPETIDLHNFYF
jgi:hypothetical protein